MNPAHTGPLPASVGPGEGHSPGRRPLGELLVGEGLITPAQLIEALRAQAASASYMPLAQILVDQSALTRAQLNLVLDRHQRKHRLGEILVETGVLTDTQLRDALQHQRETGRRLGETLLELDLVTDRQIKVAICRQFGIPFVDLDDAVVDPALRSLVSRSYAHHRRVIPVARSGDEITVALDDPGDEDVVHELRASTGCTVRVVTSTSAAFERAFARIYENGHGGASRFLAALGQAEVEKIGREASERERLAELKGALADLSAKQKEAATRLHALTREQADTGAVVESLQADQLQMVDQHEALTSDLRRLGERQSGILEALAALEAVQRALRREQQEIRNLVLGLCDQQRQILQDRAATVECLEGILRRLGQAPASGSPR